MKPVVIVLAGSLVINVALLAVLAQGLAGSAATAEAEEAAARASLAASASPAAPAAEQDGAIGPDTWTSLQTDDLRAQIDRLRAEGFPPAVVRAIITGQVQERARERLRAVNAAGTQPYWKPYSADPKLRAAQQEIWREQRALLKELLGPVPPESDPYRSAMLERQFGSLAPEKVDQLRDIQEIYDEKRSAIYSVMRGQPLPDEREKLKAIDAEMRTEFARLLTPEEFDAYQLRGSNTANQMRYELTAFDTTEDEFKTIFRLRQPFDERFSFNYGTPSQELMQQRFEAEKQLKEQIKSALGPQRGAEYERATDYSYRQTNALVSRLQLPPVTTDQVYAVQQEFQTRIQSLATNQGLSTEERNRQLVAFQQEASARLTAVLTPSGFEAYRQNGGQWLQRLQPRPAQPVRR